MKKRLIFLYRYFTTTRRWQRWINPQTVLILLITAILIGAMTWLTPPAQPHTRAAADQAATPNVTITAQPPAAPTRTPLPPEYLQNANQTIGIAVAGAILVLIIVMGSALFRPHEDR